MFFESQESHRKDVLATLSRKYHAITPLLTKIEGLVVYTNTGKSFQLRNYYKHWEKKLFESITKVSIVSFKAMIYCIHTHIDVFE